MPLAVPILQTTLADRRPDRQGKVRDIYDFGDRLLIVATDRISAFDYVLGSGIPDKGKVLTQISTFWFERLKPIVANHLLSTTPSSYPGEARRAVELLQGRSMLVTRTEPLPIECVARGYLSGSGWKDYAATGELCGIRLPAGLRESDRLAEPIFTPATKAQSATTSTSVNGTPPTWWAPTFWRASATHAPAARRGRRPRRVVRHHRRGHQIRIRAPALRRRDAHRRSAHAGLLEILAEGQL